MQQLFVIVDVKQSHLVCKLHDKALYILKKVHWVQFGKFAVALYAFGFACVKLDQSLFIHTTSIIFSIYIDDIEITRSDAQSFQFQNKLCIRNLLKNIQELDVNYFLAMQVKKITSNIYLSQIKCIINVGIEFLKV